MNYYISEYFTIQEFVPKSVYLDRGEKAWQLMDLHLLENYYALRKQLGVPITLNDWAWGGKRHWQGLRSADSSDYKVYSQHSFGRGGDADIKDIPANEVRQQIRDRRIVLPHPATFEVNVSWLHMDTRQSTDMITFVNLTDVVWRFKGE